MSWVVWKSLKCWKCDCSLIWALWSSFFLFPDGDRARFVVILTHELLVLWTNLLRSSHLEQFATLISNYFKKRSCIYSICLGDIAGDLQGNLEVSMENLNLMKQLMLKQSILFYKSQLGTSWSGSCILHITSPYKFLFAISTMKQPEILKSIWKDKK